MSRHVTFNIKSYSHLIPPLTSVKLLLHLQTSYTSACITNTHVEADNRPKPLQFRTSVHSTSTLALICLVQIGPRNGRDDDQLLKPLFIYFILVEFARKFGLGSRNVYELFHDGYDVGGNLWIAAGRSVYTYEYKYAVIIKLICKSNIIW